MAAPEVQTSSTLTPEQVAERLRDLDAVLGSQCLAGLEQSAAIVAQLARVARGELTTDAVIADIHARIARGEL